MALRFVHFLAVFSVLTWVSLSIAFTNVVQVALNSSPNFSGAILREGHWEELLDFLEQVPTKKLAFIFLTANPGHVLLAVVAIFNVMLVCGWLLQWALFSTCSSAELKAARETALQFGVFRLFFLGAILDTNRNARSAAQAAGGDPTTFAPGSGNTREVCIWLLFFCLIAFLRWFLVMLRERFQSAQSSPHSNVHTFEKYFTITVAFSVVNLLFGAVLFAGLQAHTSWAVLSLLLFENIVLVASCVKILFRYRMYITTLRREQPWEERGSSLYYCDMACDTLVQLVTLAHLLHIWSHFGLSLSVIDLFLFLHVRQLAVGVYRNLHAVRVYSKAIWELHARFPDATEEELRAVDDVCSICRDTMERAKKLPCNHLFHRSCLQQWIEFQSFCPSCRAPLVPRATNATNGNAQNPVNGAPRGVVGVPRPPEQNAILAHQQAAREHALQQQRLYQQRLQQQHHHQQQQQHQQAHPSHTVVHDAQSSSSGSSVGVSGAVASPLESGMGLRNRFGNAAPSVTGAAGSATAHTHVHSPPQDPAHGAHGHAHIHHAGGGAIPPQPIFRIDTSRISWLPNFSLEVQAAHVHRADAHAAAVTSSHVQPPVSHHIIDEMPPLEPLQQSASSVRPRTPELAPASEAVADSSTTSPPTDATNVVAPVAHTSMRDRIYMATQRRLEQETVAREATATAATAAAAEPEAAGDEAATDNTGTGSVIEQKVLVSDASVPVASSLSSAPIPSPSDPASSSSSSSSASAASAASTASLPSPPYSPPLLSQAEADANLARELQYEENLLAAEEERRRQTVGGAFARFFTGL